MNDLPPPPCSLFGQSVTYHLTKSKKKKKEKMLDHHVQAPKGVFSNGLCCCFFNIFSSRGTIVIITMGWRRFLSVYVYYIDTTGEMCSCGMLTSRSELPSSPFQRNPK